MPSEGSQGGADDSTITRASSLRALSLAANVALLEWPAELLELDELAQRGLPRLLLVSPGSPPPMCTSVLEDWVRLPIDSADLQARLFSLADRFRMHARPTVDEFGVLRLGGAVAILPPSEKALAHILIDNFGAVVRDSTLEEQVVSESNAQRSTLRTVASRLRRRVAPLGLLVSCIRNVGYMMSHDKGATA